MSVWDQGRQPSGFQPKETEFDVRLRGAAHDDESPRFEDWSPEKQRQAYEGTIRADENRAAVQENANTFLALRPELKDSKRNGDVMNNTLKAMFGNTVYSIEQFSAAYEVACANGLLELDGKVLAEQAKEASKQRAATERARIVYRSAADLETMPLEEIRRLDAEERQRAMQEEANRGGLGL